MPVYTTEALARAMAPVRTVIDSFVNEEQSSSGIHSQGRFVSLLLSIAQQNNHDDETNNQVVFLHQDNIDWASIDFLPSRRYVHKLVQRYTSQLEERNIELENDTLAALVCHFSMSPCCSTLPDPTCSCIATFRVPLANNNNDGEAQQQQKSTTNKTDDDILRIRTYPHHNDVGVAKVWEAGACLAEYLIDNPQCVSDRNVVELGSGVGLTGLIAAGVSKAKSVHMTDYTEVCLENLAYNVDENRGWLMGKDVCPGTVTAGKLEWGEYSNIQNENEDTVGVNGHARGSPWADSIEALSEADVLLAADVIYDVNSIPDLIATVSKFLSQTTLHSDGIDERVAIFASTYRNENTFALFEKELEEKNIVFVYHSLEDLPNIFPCYFNQPRSDIRVCTMRMNHQ